MIQKLSTVGIDNFLNPIKSIYINLTSNIVLNGERWIAFPEMRNKVRILTVTISIQCCERNLITVRQGLKSIRI